MVLEFFEGWVLLRESVGLVWLIVNGIVCRMVKSRWGLGLAFSAGGLRYLFCFMLIRGGRNTARLK